MEVVENQRLDQLCMKALAGSGDAPAIEFNKQWITWGEIRVVADRVAELIEASGTQSGARIALVARNHPAAIAAFLGLIAHNYSLRMVYPFQSAAGIVREIEGIAPAAVVAADADFTESVVDVLREKGIAGVALRDMEVVEVEGAQRSGIHAELPAEPQIEILTSGTTGKPKPFCLTYKMIASHLVGTVAAPDKEAGDPAAMTPMLLYFPVGNISGLYTTLPTLIRGQRAILLERFSVEGWHDHLLRFRPMYGGLPPAGVQMVLDAGLPKEDLACLRVLGAGAAPLDPKVKKAFEERYGVPILLSYGATEFGGPVTRMTPADYQTFGEQKADSVGRALPGVKLRVINPDSGEELPLGEEGILEVVSPRIGRDWIRTSDIAVIDEDGFLFPRGRADGAIMRGGFKLLPETIEGALLLHPAVSAAAVVGIVDHRLGQVPAAAVVPKPGAGGVTPEELEAHLRGHVLKTHIPTVWRIVQELPRTRLSFKVDRDAVCALFE